MSARLCRLPKHDEYWKQYLICSPLASKLQIAVNKDVIDIDNFSLQKWSPMASEINREELRNTMPDMDEMRKLITENNE